MKIATPLAAAAGTRQPDWDETVRYAVEADRLGVDSIWSAEAWIYDAVSPLGYLAACTERIQLGAGILQATARAPAVTAMTALSLNRICGGRFLLGLGASGPKVVEALHGIPFERPVQRLRETLEIVRIALAGKPVVYHGRQLELPWSGLESDALRLGLAPDPDIPLYVGSLSPSSLELTGELADGWLAQVFVPEGAEPFFEAIARGAQRAGRELAALDVVAGAPVSFGEDTEALIDGARRNLAFTLGAMGTPSKNFYVDAYARSGYEEVATRVQALWNEGDRAAATRAVPDDLVLRTHLFGSEAMIRERIRAYRDAGVTTLRVAPQGDSVSLRMETLARIVDLIRDEASG